MSIIILVVFVVVSVVVSVVILFIIRIVRQKNKDIEVVDDNPDYGNDDTEDYEEGGTQVVDNNDYYE